MIEILQSMQKLNLENGDILVLKTSQYIKEDIFARIKKTMEETLAKWGYEPRVILLEGDFDLAILHKEEPIKWEEIII
jgi:hypothetical protein